jgi:aminoglycoside 6'-N-acetyltransferase
MQDCAVHGGGDHPFDHLPSGSRGMEKFIGSPDMIGNGHGQAFIRQRLKGLFAQGIPVVATDPHPDNKRAIRAYELVGFRIAGPARDTAWGRILPMEARVGAIGHYLTGKCGG